jgi:hypothetical protein
MKNKVFAVLSVLGLIVCTLAYAEVPQYTAMKTGSKMAMDGILDEPAWQKAKPVGPFQFQWYKSGEKEQTVAKILWDDERIYFSFKCDDKHIRAEHYTNGDPVSRDDCCEAFICPVPEGNERLDYLNYEINCIGTRLLGYHAKSRDKNFYWKDVTGIEIGRVINGTCNNDDDIDTGWVLEFSVPFTHFRAFDTTAEKKDDPPDAVTHIRGFGAEFPPKDGQAIYIGLHRCGGKTNPQYSQWSPSQTERPSFHQPQDFGKVIFSTEVLR